MPKYHYATNGKITQQVMPLKKFEGWGSLKSLASHISPFNSESKAIDDNLDFDSLFDKQSNKIETLKFNRRVFSPSKFINSVTS